MLREPTPPCLRLSTYPIPCEHSECGEHVLRLDRDLFTEAVKRELRLVEVEAGSFELSADDLALLGQ